MPCNSTNQHDKVIGKRRNTKSTMVYYYWGVLLFCMTMTTTTTAFSSALTNSGRLQRLSFLSTPHSATTGYYSLRRIHCYAHHSDTRHDNDNDDIDDELFSKIDNNDVQAVTSPKQQQQQQQYLTTTTLQNENNKNRRSFLMDACWTTMVPTLSSLVVPERAMARAGLVQFPCQAGDLGNTYNFMRSGESLLEADHIWTTNPLFLTNREAALSDKGVEQVERTCQALLAGSKGGQDPLMSPTIVRYSLAASAIDTANIVGRTLNIGRDRLVPEFNFMDPRAVGKWDMLPLESTQAAIVALDNDEAGPYGKQGRPPPNEDSTPHETLGDQAVRLRQLLSVLETQYSGDTVLLIFPDGTGPALLSAMMAGIDLNRVHELEFAPSEIRLNVTMESTFALLHRQETEPTYQDNYQKLLQQGRDELITLRTSAENGDIINVKDQRLEQDRLEVEAQQQQLQEAKKQREELQKQEQRNRTKQIEQERQRKRDALVEERKQKQQQQQLQKQQQQLQKQQQQGDGSSSSNAVQDNTTTNDSSSSPSPMSVVVGSLGAFGLGALSLLQSGEEDDTNDNEAAAGLLSKNETVVNSTTTEDEDMVVVMADTTTTTTMNTNVSVTMGDDDNDDDNDDKTAAAGITKNQTTTTTTTTTIPLPSSSINLLEDISSQLDSIATSTSESTTSDDDATTTVLTAKQAMQNYLDEDDGGAAWLQSLNEIIEEPDNNDPEN